MARIFRTQPRWKSQNILYEVFFEGWGKVFHGDFPGGLVFSEFLNLFISMTVEISKSD